MTQDGKILKVVESRLRAHCVDLTRYREPSDDLGDLDIEQVRCMERLGPVEEASLDRFSSRSTQ